ncbi:MAG: type II toxin-antitoxin system Phd/YefM family antitoxin [Candidatus Xenobia bacterium]
MRRVTFSELRNHAKKYFDAVEQVESIEIYRNGKPVAILSPVTPRSDRWKQGHPLKLQGVSLSRAVLADRDANLF